MRTTLAAGASFWVATFQQILGILLNVFLTAVVVSKFMHPIIDLAWTKSAVISYRDGMPVLMMRVANLRCHTLYRLLICTVPPLLTRQDFFLCHRAESQ